MGRLEFGTKRSLFSAILFVGGILLLISCQSVPFVSSTSLKNLVPNSEFEIVDSARGLPQGWQRVLRGESSDFALESGGHNSPRSVSLTGRGEWSTIILGIQPQKYYLLSFWVKREGIKDGEYPFLLIFDREIHLNELFSSGSWRRASYIINPKITIKRF